MDLEADSPSRDDIKQSARTYAQSLPLTSDLAAAPASVTLDDTVILPQRIVLTGFMGSGKSTVGRLLSRHLNWRFVDVDAEIEQATGKTVAAIFADDGEPRFRELEHKTIRAMTSRRDLVISLGGGAIEDDRTRKLLLQTEGTRLVHLEIALETVWIRCKGSESVRPILADRAHLAERYDRRLPLYRESHMTLVVDQMRPAVVVEAILSQIRKRPSA